MSMHIQAIVMLALNTPIGEKTLLPLFTFINILIIANDMVVYGLLEKPLCLFQFVHMSSFNYSFYYVARYLFENDLNHSLKNNSDRQKKTFLL